MFGVQRMKSIALALEFWNKLFWGCKGMANLTGFCGVLPRSPRRGTAVPPLPVVNQEATKKMVV